MFSSSETALGGLFRQGEKLYKSTRSVLFSDCYGGYSRYREWMRPNAVISDAAVMIGCVSICMIAKQIPPAELLADIRW